MKQALLSLSCFLFSLVCFSQNEKLLQGKVLSEGKSLANIDIVNINSKKSVITSTDGSFSILVKLNDVLFIISKEYTDRKITITDADLEQNNFEITLEKRPIELEDVNITRVKSMKIKLPQADLNAARIYKEANAPKVLGVYDGTTPGINFMTLGRQLIDMFSNKDKKKPKKAAPLPEFKDYIRSTFADSFFIQKLKLNPDEIGLFISYCEADPKAKILVEKSDFFESMNFLVIKNNDFRKLNSLEK